VWGMATRVTGEAEGAVVREGIVLVVETAEKSQLTVQAQEAVNAGERAPPHFFFLISFGSAACDWL
jgi:hypothetical protein